MCEYKTPSASDEKSHEERVGSPECGGARAATCPTPIGSRLAVRRRPRHALRADHARRPRMVLEIMELFDAESWGQRK